MCLCGVTKYILVYTPVLLMMENVWAAWVFYSCCCLLTLQVCLLGLAHYDMHGVLSPNCLPFIYTCHINEAQIQHSPELICYIW